MLRKRTRSHHKDQHMGHLTSDAVLNSNFHSDVQGQKLRNNPFFNVPGLFVGFNSKVSEYDSVRSPTSPLDFRVFSSFGPFGNPFRSPRLSHEGQQKSWDSNKVGLSIIDSLDGETNQSGKVLRSSDSKNILFGPQMRMRTPKYVTRIDSFQAPKSLPKNIAIFPYTTAKPSNLQDGNSDVLLEFGEGPLEQESVGNIRSCSLDSGKSSSRLIKFGYRTSSLSSGNFDSENTTKELSTRSQSIFEVGDSSSSKLSSFPAVTSIHSGLLGAQSTSEIELSEDYTCVRTHGPKPKITHIYGDCVLECHGNELCSFPKNDGDVTILQWEATCSDILTKYPSDDFLRFCFSCKKRLDGEDIYMYRGEKAFCSYDCRSQEILIDEEMDKTNNDP